MGANAVIDEIYRTRIVRDESGNEYNLIGEIDAAEGDYLHRLISADLSVTKTLEIGCAYGLSALHICEALRGRANASHTIVDPWQMGPWHGVGITHLNRAGIDFFRLIPEGSELALPTLIRGESGTFDLVFIDGVHTLDHTLLDLFYANRLIRVGGYIIVDDCRFRSVSAAISYFNNYPSFETVTDPVVAVHSMKQRISKAITRVLRPGLARMTLPTSIYDRYYRRILFPSMIALKKIGEDTRSWAWYEGF